VFCKCGKGNSFSKGVIIYENAKIGHDNHFSPYVIVNNAIIENYCSIGPGSKIGLGEHDIHAISTYPKMGNGDGKMVLFDVEKPTVIGSDVWIGANSVVKQGVSIGNGAIIGAGSVVTKDVEPYSIVVGIPARHLRYRFSDETIRAIRESEWYSYCFSEAREIVKQLYKRGTTE
jgi:acetyltransferase-like isoleucine patch superfamily enzyme